MNLPHKQGFSLASALGHSPKNNPDVRDIDDQAGHFIREGFFGLTLYLIVGKVFILKNDCRLVRFSEHVTFAGLVLQILPT